MHKLAQCFAMMLLTPLLCRAQDERYFRDLFSKELQKKEEQNAKAIHFRAASPFYKLDLSGDGLEESMVLEKRDGEDWFNLHAPDGKRLASFPLNATGLDSRVHKVRVRELSPKTRVLLLYFYEGATSHVNLKSIERLYFLTVDDKDPKTAALHKGPVIWDEEAAKNHYHQRRYGPFLKDYNGDGVREVAVKHQYVTRVYMYRGQGKWSEL